MTSIGDRLRALRKSMGLTQVQLAERTGIRQNTISDLERGDSKTMAADTLQSLCRELVTTPNYLLDGVDNGEQFEAALQEAELLAIFRELPATAQSALIDNARLLRRAIPSPSEANPFPSAPPPPPVRRKAKS